MSRTLLDCISADLEAWTVGLEPEFRTATARRIAEHLDSHAGRAEQRLKDGTSISWLYDVRSGQLLATYPNGANRIRIVGQPGIPTKPEGQADWGGTHRLRK